MNLRKIALYAMGPGLTALFGVITIPVMAWLVPQDDIGRVSILLIFSSLFTIVGMLGFDQSFIRHYYEKKDKHLCFSSCIYPAFVFFILALGVLLFFYVDISHLLFGTGYHNLIYVVMFYFIILFFNRFWSILLRVQDRAAAFSINQIIPKFLFLAFILIFYFLDRKVEFDELVKFYAISYLVALFVLFVFNYKFICISFYTKPSISFTAEMFKYGCPLVFSAVFYWGITALDKLFLKYYSTLADVAVYSVAISFASIGMLFQMIFSTIWAPMMYKDAGKNFDLDRFIFVVDLLTAFILILVAFCAFLSPFLLYILPEEYSGVPSIFFVCLLFPLLYTLSEATVIGIGLAKKSNYSLLASFIALMINLVGNLILIPIFGVKGAAMSTSISFLVLFIVRTEFSARLWCNFPRGKVYLFMFLITILANLNMLYFDEYVNLFFLIWFISATLSLYVYRHPLKTLYYNIFKRRQVSWN